MRLEVVQAFEAEATQSAAIRSLPRVGALVDLQNVCPREALIAHATPVRFLLRVNASVQLEVPQAAKLVPAHSTAVWLVTSLVTLV